uniref:BAR domain-containing protein n=1 Tax=Globodera pallida TaxID=36090 RepID=A0A183BM48_GLOPA
MAAKSAEAQLKGAAILTKWAGKSNNEAMADVVARVGELMEMHAERQRTFAKDYGRQLHKVAETERKMRAQCRRVEKLADEERRLGKMLVKKGGGDELSAQLERVKREREWAEREVEEERHEAEFARMAHLAAGLEGLADVQLNLARAGQLIFACQRELAAFVCKERPTEREGPTRQRHRYGGVPQTQQKMAELRRSLEAGEMEMAYNAPSSVERRQRQRRSEPCSLANDRHGDRFRPNQQRQPISHPLGTPPPPYTPSAPPLELLDSVTRPSNTNRHSVGPSFFSDGINNGPPVARIYPQLPPNPFAEELKQRRRCRGPISVE